MTDRRSHLLKTLPPQHFVGLANEVAELEQAGRDIIRLGQGTPDLPTPEPICDALQTALLDASTHQYGPFRGQARLKQAVATFYLNEYGVELDPETEVANLVSSRCRNAYSNLATGFCYRIPAILITSRGHASPVPSSVTSSSGKRTASCRTMRRSIRKMQDSCI